MQEMLEAEALVDLMPWSLDMSPVSERGGVAFESATAGLYPLHRDLAGREPSEQRFKALSVNVAMRFNRG